MTRSLIALTIVLGLAGTASAASRVTTVSRSLASPGKVMKCPAWPSGSGILSDGDFHLAVEPPTAQRFLKARNSPTIGKSRRVP